MEINDGALKGRAPPGAADSSLSRVETSFLSFVCVPALLAEGLNEPRPGGGGGFPDRCVVRGRKRESPTRWAEFAEWMFFSLCVCFQLVGGGVLDGRVIPLAVACLLLLCVGAAAICPADAD